MQEHYLYQAHDIETRIERLGNEFESLTLWLENSPDKQWVAKRRSDKATFYGSTPYEAIERIYRTTYKVKSEHTCESVRQLKDVANTVVRKL